MNENNNNNSRISNICKKDNFTSKKFKLIFIFTLLYLIIFIISLKIITINIIYNKYLKEIKNIKYCDDYYRYYYDDYDYDYEYICEKNRKYYGIYHDIDEETVIKYSKYRIILNVFSLIFFTGFLISLFIEKKIFKISLFMFIIRFIIINSIFLYEIISDFVFENIYKIKNFVYNSYIRNNEKFSILELHTKIIFYVYLFSGIYNLLILCLIYYDFICALKINLKRFRNDNNISNNNDINNNININNNDININNNDIINNNNNNRINNNNKILFKNKKQEQFYNSILSLSFQIVFDPIKHNSFEEKSCGICLGDFEKNQQILIIPCLHKFHFDCISKWLIKNTTCPFDQMNLEKIVEDSNNHNNIKKSYNQFFDNININNIDSNNNINNSNDNMNSINNINNNNHTIINVNNNSNVIQNINEINNSEINIALDENNNNLNSNENLNLKEIIRLFIEDHCYITNYSSYYLKLSKSCNICNKMFKFSEEMLILPCFHIYHKNCVEERLLKNELKPCVKCLISIDYILINDNNNYNEIRTDKNKNKFPIINNDSYLNKTYPEQIELFYNDIIKYFSSDKYDVDKFQDDKECNICLNKYKNGDNIIITNCMHKCHKFCFRRYIFFYNKCFQCGFDFKMFVK